MTDEQWIVIPKWDRYQHYKKRDVPWIKDYCAQLHNPDYLELTLAQRGLLRDLRLLYALSHKHLPCSPQKVGSMLGVTVKQAQLVSLNHAGFIQLVSRQSLEQSSTTYYSKSGASPASLGGDAPQELEAALEPARDPDAVRKIQDLIHQVWSE